MLFACASPMAPTGGPKDKRAPQLLKDESSQNLLTNFKEKEIRLTFDEWVKLNDINKQVVISPPLAHRPEIILRGKTLRFKFDEQEELKQNTTYSINFGESVKDITEGNAAENLKYVFSTGDFIDSLSVRGKVVDSKTGEGLKDVLVMLYDNLADTIVRTERPYYFAKTDKQGTFIIDYVRADTFKVFALQDANLNYLYDKPTEAIGFPDDFFVLDTSQQTPLKIKLFNPRQPLQLQETNYREYGRLQLGFNQAPDSIELEYLSYFDRTVKELTKDSVLLFYDKKTIDSTKWEIIVKTKDRTIDTLNFKIPRVIDFVKAGKKMVSKESGRQKRIELAPNADLELAFHTPVWAIDTSKIIVVEDDSIRKRIYPVVESNPNSRLKVNLKDKWKESQQYAVEVLPGALEDIYGVKNDTLKYKFAVKKAKDYGILKLQLDSLDSDKQYVVQLLFGDKLEGEKRIVSEKTSILLEYEQLIPGTYSLELTEDLNGNKVWDAGDYDEKRQSERYFKSDLPPVRKNWEVETTVKLVFK